MKSIDYILDHYNDFAVMIDDRFGRRFAEFLTVEQMKRIGCELKEEYKATHKPKEWTEENILKQLYEDVQFGWMKCVEQRGISASLMADLVQKWCDVLENGLVDIPYGYYGDNVFKTVAKKYGWALKYGDDDE